MIWGFIAKQGYGKQVFTYFHVSNRVCSVQNLITASLTGCRSNYILKQQTRRLIHQGTSNEETSLSSKKSQEDSNKSYQGIISTTSIENTRNFSIIAHVDHGKSTLADRLLEYTGTIKTQSSNKQVLDKLQVERERGITVKAQTASMIHKYSDENFLLNLIDTPGHVDFSYEVSRSLLACQGVLLVVDAAQGIQAQTVANFRHAEALDLDVIPVINKIDLKTADPERVARQLTNLFGFQQESILKVSAKTGIGMTDVLSSICNNIRNPSGSLVKPLRAVLCDSWFDQYRGVICMVSIIDGCLKTGDSVTFVSTNKSYEVIDIGVFKPEELSTGKLTAGQVGYIVTGLRKTSEALPGDTIHLEKKPCVPLPGFRQPQPMVFAGVYPSDQSFYAPLKKSLEKLTLNDPSVTVHPDVSAALGQGFSIGFLGLLHMDVFKQRLEQEYGMTVIVTSPNVPYKAVMKNNANKEIEILSPSQFPNNYNVQEFYEPVVEGTLMFPEDYLGKVITLCEERRGIQTQLEYIDDHYVLMKYKLPLNEVVLDFFDHLKSVSSGYASFDYEDAGYEPTKISKLEILINSKSVDALSVIVHNSQSQRVGKEICRRLKDTIQRQMFEVVIQASVGGRIIGRETIKAFRKDVTAKCYGGDVTRKRKLLDKQKEGKKKMKRIGNVDLPHTAFLAVVKR